MAANFTNVCKKALEAVFKQYGMTRLKTLLMSIKPMLTVVSCNATASWHYLVNNLTIFYPKCHDGKHLLQTHVKWQYSSFQAQHSMTSQTMPTCFKSLSPSWNSQDFYTKHQKHVNPSSTLSSIWFFKQPILTILPESRLTLSDTTSTTTAKVLTPKSVSQLPWLLISSTGCMLVCFFTCPSPEHGDPIGGNGNRGRENYLWSQSATQHHIPGASRNPYFSVCYYKEQYTCKAKMQTN